MTPIYMRTKTIMSKICNKRKKTRQHQNLFGWVFVFENDDIWDKIWLFFFRFTMSALLNFKINRFNWNDCMYFLAIARTTTEILFTMMVTIYSFILWLISNCCEYIFYSCTQRTQHYFIYPLVQFVMRVITIAH